MTSVADPGCFSRIPNPNFSILDPDPGSRVKKIPDPGSGCASKNLSILTQKIVSKLSEIRSWLFIPDPDPGSVILIFYPSRIPDPGSRGQKGTAPRIRNTGKKQCRQKLQQRQWQQQQQRKATTAAMTMPTTPDNSKARQQSN